MDMIEKINRKNSIKVIQEQSKGVNTTRFLDTGNRFLIVLITGLCGHVSVKYFSAGQNAALLFAGHEVIAEKVSSAALTIDEPKSFEVYAKGIEDRDLFQSLRDKLKTDTPALRKALPALHKRIKLVGILLDGDSKAIVEDLKEKQTRFLSRGESIGTVFLEDIREDKVIFMYNNERVEMAL